MFAAVQIAGMTGVMFAVGVVHAETAKVPDVLYPGREFVRLPFNTSCTVEMGCGFVGRATPIDAGDGIVDLVLGVEDGYLYHFRNPLYHFRNPRSR